MREIVNFLIEGSNPFIPANLKNLTNKNLVIKRSNMKKLSKFKKQKIEAAEYLSELPIRHFNRFTQQEVSLALNKPVLETSNDVYLLVRWCFDNTKSVKLNFDRFLVNIKIVRTGQKRNDSINNRVWIEVAQRFSDSRLVNEFLYANSTAHVKKLSKARKPFKILQEFRPEIITELAKIGIINNILCDIFDDRASIQDHILENPKLFISEEEIIQLERNY